MQSRPPSRRLHRDAGTGLGRRRLPLAGIVLVVGVVGVLGVLGVVASVSVGSSGAANGVGEPTIEYDADAESVVLSFVDASAELDDPAGPPTMRIHGDGRVQVHYPAYMRRAGDYSMTLSRSALRRLLRSLSDQGVMDFDTHSARQALKRERRRRARDGVAESQAGSRPSSLRGGELPALLHARSDDTVTRFELRLVRYHNAASGQAERRDLRKKISWRGLQLDADEHPGLSEIRKLAHARRLLLGLMNHPQLRREK